MLGPERTASLNFIEDFLDQCEGMGDISPCAVLDAWKKGHTDLVSFLGSPILNIPTSQAATEFLLDDLTTQLRYSIEDISVYPGTYKKFLMFRREGAPAKAAELFHGDGTILNSAWEKFWTDQRDHILEHGTVRVGNRQFRPMKLLGYLFKSPEHYPTGHWTDEYSHYSGMENRLNNMSHYIGNADRINREFVGKKMEYVIDCSPPAFMNLGSYGADRGSCFAAGHEWEAGPIILCGGHGSFVGLLKIGGRVVGRHFGFILPELKTIFTSNFYPRDDSDLETLTIRTAKDCLERWAREVFKDETCRVVNRISKHPEFDLYWNDDHWGVKPQGQGRITLKTHLDLNTSRTVCSDCGNPIIGEVSHDFEGEPFHPSCITESRYWVEGPDEYYPDHMVVEDVYGYYILKDDAVETYNGDYIHENEAIELKNGEWADENDPNIVEVNGDWYVEGTEPEEKEQECESQ